mmetsp:Transcript_14756/g.35650  ORF Transcript_14756/g.35650 Transcript_14756/m.35650 type:complete len:86 (+) Transcript_14756:146-403(+)
MSGASGPMASAGTFMQSIAALQAAEAAADEAMTAAQAGGKAAARATEEAAKLAVQCADAVEQAGIARAELQQAVIAEKNAAATMG